MIYSSCLRTLLAFASAFPCARGGSLGPGSDVQLKATATIDIVRQHGTSETAIHPAANIRPGPPSEIEFSKEDCEFDYKCYCQNAYSYALRVPSVERSREIESVLRQLASGPLFGCYDTDFNLQGRHEHKCRLVGKAPMNKRDNALSRLNVPNDLPETMTVWFEYSVRVDDKALPLENASRQVMPILIQGDQTVYEVVQSEKEGDSHCGLDVHFAGKVFDLTSCGTNLRCLEKVHEAYLSSIRYEFSQDPLGASEIHDEPIPPGEIWMRRAYSSSIVLGPPFFELSTYVFKIWFAAYDHGDFSITPRTDLHMMFINASGAFTRSVGIHGDYVEPTPEQNSAYRNASSAMLSKALERACETIHGHVNNSVCTL